MRCPRLWATKSCRAASSRNILVSRLSPSEMTCVAAYFSFLLKPRALTPIVYTRRLARACDMAMSFGLVGKAGGDSSGAPMAGGETESSFSVMRDGETPGEAALGTGVAPKDERELCERSMEGRVLLLSLLRNWRIAR